MILAYRGFRLRRCFAGWIWATRWVALPCLERLVPWVRRLIAPLGVVASGRQGHQLWFVNAPKSDVASN